jgi:predicted metalloprotease
MRGRAALLAAAIAASCVVLAAPAHAAASGGSGGAGGSIGGAAGRSTPYQKVLAAAITGLQTWWRDEFPTLYGDDYQPIPRSRIIAARPGVQLPACQGHRTRYADVRGNAFYCLKSNFIAYDDAFLMPKLAQTFGTFSGALMLAHEWGHAIQDRAGNGEQQTVYMEQQADCFAGAFLEHMAQEGRGTLHLVPGDLEASLGAMLQLRDAPGQSAEDPSAHGSAFDRISAFQDGFESGAERCAQYFDNPPVLVEVPFSSPEEEKNGGNVPADQVISLTVNVLNEFYSQVEPAYQELSTDDIVSFNRAKPKSIPECGGRTLPLQEVENRVFYCASDGYFAFDEPFLQAVYEKIGDFGVAALLANPWATYVQTIQGTPGVEDNALPAVFQADCYTGGWSAALFNRVLSAGSLSAGDLDEAVQALLVYSRARGVKEDVPITFLRLAFFRVGFTEGYKACNYQVIAQAASSLK